MDGYIGSYREFLDRIKLFGWQKEYLANMFSGIGRLPVGIFNSRHVDSEISDTILRRIYHNYLDIGYRQVRYKSNDFYIDGSEKYGYGIISPQEQALSASESLSISKIKDFINESKPFHSGDLYPLSIENINYLFDYFMNNEAIRTSNSIYGCYCIELDNGYYFNPYGQLPENIKLDYKLPSEHIVEPYFFNLLKLASLFPDEKYTIKDIDVNTKRNPFDLTLQAFNFMRGYFKTEDYSKNHYIKCLARNNHEFKLSSEQIMSGINKTFLIPNRLSVQITNFSKPVIGYEIELVKLLPHQIYKKECSNEYIWDVLLKHKRDEVMFISIRKINTGETKCYKCLFSDGNYDKKSLDTICRVGTFGWSNMDEVRTFMEKQELYQNIQKLNTKLSWVKDILNRNLKDIIKSKDIEMNFILSSEDYSSDSVKYEIDNLLNYEIRNRKQSSQRTYLSFRVLG